MILDFSEIARVSDRWSGPSFWSPAIGRQGGVCVLISPNFPGKVLSLRKDSAGRVLTLLISIGTCKINLVNIYAPTNLTERKVSFDDLHEFFLSADRQIISGDFNCYERESTELDNWQPKLNNLEKSLNLWKSRFLSYVGKSMNLNVLGLSKFLYLSRTLVMPVWVLTRINQLIWLFLWGSRIETVSRRSCCLSLKNGVLNVCDLRLKCEALRLTATIATVDNADDSSFFLCKYFIGRRLSSLRPQWAGLRDVAAPCAALPTAFYENVLDTLGKIGGDPPADSPTPEPSASSSAAAGSSNPAPMDASEFDPPMPETTAPSSAPAEPSPDPAPMDPSDSPLNDVPPVSCSPLPDISDSALAVAASVACFF